VNALHSHPAIDRVVAGHAMPDGRLLKALSGRSNWRGAAAIARDWAAIVAIAFADMRYGNWLTYFVAIWAIGAFQFAISECLLHEASHYNLFVRKRANDLAEVLVALPFFQTVASFRNEHRLHHRYLMSMRDSLPEEYRVYGLTKENKEWFWLWFVKPIIGYSAIMMGRGGQSSGSSRDAVKICLFWAAAALVMTLIGRLDALFFYWIVPMVLCKGAFLYWSEIADHFNTRSGCRTRTGSLANTLFHNNGYHHAHHRFPAVTQFNLKRLHEATMREGDDISHGFLDTYRQLKGPSATGVPI
jgi:fatty acid desaturase